MISISRMIKYKIRQLEIVNNHLCTLNTGFKNYLSPFSKEASFLLSALCYLKEMGSQNKDQSIFAKCTKGLSGVL